MLLLAKVDLMIGLSCHAARNTAKGDVRDAVDDANAGLFSIPVETDADAAENDGKAHQAVTAPDEPDIVLIEAKAVLVANEHRVGTSSQARAATRLEAHTRDRTSAIAALSRLQTAASSKVALAALVV